MRSRYVARTSLLEARSPGRRSNVENAPRRRSVTGQPATPTSHVRRAILRTPPSPAGHRPAARAEPAERSHYVVVSRDGRKLVTRVRVMFAWQRNPCPDCNSAQYCTTRGSLYHAAKLHPGPCSRVGVRLRTDRQTDMHTDARDHNTFCVIYDSHKM